MTIALSPHPRWLVDSFITVFMFFITFTFMEIHDELCLKD